MRFHLGVDVGQVNDATAFVLLDTKPDEAERGENLRVVRYIARFFPKRYGDITDAVLELRANPLLRGRCTVAVDATGVGRAIIEQMRDAYIATKPVSIHAGEREIKDEETGYHRVPKRDLVSALQVAMQNGVFQVPPDVEHRETLIDELRNFRVKVSTAGNEQFAAWREKEHDDLVLAAAIAVWSANRETDSDLPPPIWSEVGNAW